MIVLYGSRQAGKTTLAKALLQITNRHTRYINADKLIYRDALASQYRQRLDAVLADAEVLTYLLMKLSVCLTLVST